MTAAYIMEEERFLYFFVLLLSAIILQTLENFLTNYICSGLKNKSHKNIEKFDIKPYLPCFTKK